MNVKPIINAALTGTSAMTLFSYLISEKQEENFKEPFVLADLISRIRPSKLKSDAAVEGWGLHFLVGFMFASGYHKLWNSGKVKPGLISGSLLGAASGLVGIMVWKAVFKFHPNPPTKSLKKYFGHLLLAHVVFGAFAGLGYKPKAEVIQPDIY